MVATDSRAAADQRSVDYVHRCAFCGWRRDASSEVMLAPRCGACGCTLEASVKQPPNETGPGVARRASRAAKPLAAMVVAGLLVAAARAGYTAGGVAAAVVAVAAMAFLLLPFLRLPDQSRFTASGENAGRHTEM
jgi:hypothetical protein